MPLRLVAPTLKIIIPATPDGLHPSVIPAILRQDHIAQVWPMLDTESYFELVAVFWAACQDFAIVEHDMELAHDELDAFERCPELWCAHSYEVFSGDLATAYGGPFGLGCVRFRAELLDKHPDAVMVAGEMNIHPVHPQRSYAVMDSTLTQVLRSRGEVPHQHFPNVRHHHAYMRENTLYG
jgi:hypothetical protein